MISVQNVWLHSVARRNQKGNFCPFVKKPAQGTPGLACLELIQKPFAALPQYES
jgi:hypothetical protein